MSQKPLNYFLIVIILFLASALHYQNKRFASAQLLYAQNIEDIEYRFRALFEGEDDFKRELIPPFIADSLSSTMAPRECLKTSLNLRSLIALNTALSRLESKLSYQENVINRLFQLMPVEIEILKTDETSKFSDVNIFNLLGVEDRNTGPHSPMFNFGFMTEDSGIRVIERGLMEVDIVNQIPNRAEVISAVLYMKQNPSNPETEIFDEKINIYELKKTWKREDSEGISRVSWNWAVNKELRWNTPGIWPDENDVNLAPIASAEGIQKSSQDQWVAFYFNAEGIKSLQKIVNGGPNYGWLLKLERRETEAHISFKSSDHPQIEDRPYLKIRYLKRENINKLSNKER